MGENVKDSGSSAPTGSGRAYDSTLRSERAAANRRAILGAARACFTETGYAATSMAAISRRAGVSVDTIYASLGKKPEVLRQLVETSLSGGDQEVSARDRDYVKAVRNADTAPEKLSIYAAAIVGIQQRLAPIFVALTEAAVSDPDCANLRRGIASRRAANMLDFAADLRATGELRAELTDREVADIIWSMNATEYWLLFVERGWTPERFQRWLVDAWTRLLLSNPSDRAS
jgi:AcrR family transcriptional regulator